MIPSVKNFAKDTRGNVAMMFGFMAVPIIFVTGMTIDYSVASRVHTKLNAAADAAALAAVTPSMMAKTDAQAVTAAKNMFTALMSGMTSLQYDPNGVTVTPTHPNGNMNMRDVTVEYVEQSTNIFGGVLGAPTIQVHGIATARASVAPNIDFFMLLDTSPSMAIPGTVAGINQMVALTKVPANGAPGQDGGNGCAFACHQAQTNVGDPANNPKVNGMQVDNYQLAKMQNPPIVLRADLVQSAMSQLTTTANNSENNSSLPVKPIYRFAVNTFDESTRTIMGDTTSNPPYVVPIGKPSGNYVSAWGTASSKMVVQQMWQNGTDCKLDAAKQVIYPCTVGNGNGDTNTNFDLALSTINGQMPNPGNGTNVAGDKPQEILFLVTDGVEDEYIPGVSRSSGGSANRSQQPLNTPIYQQNYCNTIKARNIKIAILYTTYFPLPANWWYTNTVAPWVSQVGPALQACASTGLYFEVAVGEDIGGALSSLFQQAIQSAHLTN